MDQRLAERSIEHQCISDQRNGLQNINVFVISGTVYRISMYQRLAERSIGHQLNSKQLRFLQEISLLALNGTVYRTSMAYFRRMLLLVSVLSLVSTSLALNLQLGPCPATPTGNRTNSFFFIFSYLLHSLRLCNAQLSSVLAGCRSEKQIRDFIMWYAGVLTTELCHTSKLVLNAK